MGGDTPRARRRMASPRALAADAALEVILCGPADVVEPFAAEHDVAFPQVRLPRSSPWRSILPAPCARRSDFVHVAGCRLVKEAAQGFFGRLHWRCLAAGTLVMAVPWRRPACAGHGHPVARASRRHRRHRRKRRLQAHLVQFGQMASIYAEKVIGTSACAPRRSTSARRTRRVAVRTGGVQPAGKTAAELRGQREGSDIPVAPRSSRHHHRRLPRATPEDHHRGDLEDRFKTLKEP